MASLITVVFSKDLGPDWFEVFSPPRKQNDGTRGNFTDVTRSVDFSRTKYGVPSGALNERNARISHRKSTLSAIIFERINNEGHMDHHGAIFFFDLG